MPEKRLWCWSCQQMIDVVERQEPMGFRYWCPRCGGGIRTNATKPSRRFDTYPRKEPRGGPTEEARENA